MVEKRRVSAVDAEVGFVIGEVKGKNILLVDDMITTAGSLAGAARILREQGARDIYAAAAHGVLCGPAVQRLKDSPFKEIVITDSIPLNNESKNLHERITVLSVSDLLGEAIRRIHLNQSISSLFATK